MRMSLQVTPGTAKESQQTKRQRSQTGDLKGNSTFSATPPLKISSATSLASEKDKSNSASTPSGPTHRKHESSSKGTPIVVQTFKNMRDDKKRRDGTIPVQGKSTANVGLFGQGAAGEYSFQKMAEMGESEESDARRISLKVIIFIHLIFLFLCFCENL